MNQPADARLTPDIAQGVCARTGSAAVLEGSIAALGSQYVVGLRVPINVGQHMTATEPTPLEGPLAGDQLPMPAKQRVRRDHGCDLPQGPPAQAMSSGGQSSPVVIG